jgi:hypothetical protein
MFQFETLQRLLNFLSLCIEPRILVTRTGAICLPMFTHDYHLLEREFNETTLRLAGLLDENERNRLTQRLTEIVWQARAMVKSMDYPMPKWCAGKNSN